MCEPRRLTTVRASAASYRDTRTFTLLPGHCLTIHYFSLQLNSQLLQTLLPLNFKPIQKEDKMRRLFAENLAEYPSSLCLFWQR
jgi:hypothetical protein